MQFEINVLLEQRQAILDGVLNTLTISLLSGLLAIGLGLVTAFGKKSTLPPISWLSAAYIQFFRNTPLLVQLYFFYKGLPHLGLTLAPFLCGVLALSLQAGAYMAEIFRVGLDAIPKEQYESGRSLGLSKLQTYRSIILPQALAIILPPTGNQMIGLMKNSSLVAFITVPDLFHVIYEGGAAHFRYLEFFTLGILLYMTLTLGVSGLFWLLEKQIPLLRRALEVQHA